MTIDEIQSRNGFELKGGQRAFIERMSKLDGGIVAAETGCGKTLIAITLMQVFEAKRVWVIAPKGVSISEGDTSQWVSEIKRFHKSAKVFTLYRKTDADKIIAKHGELPPGVYVSSFDSAFSLDAIETPPHRGDSGLASAMGRWSSVDGSARTVGLERNGIRCIFQPSMATLHGDKFDMVVVDECHVIGADTIAARALSRLQPKHRWAFSATPMRDQPEDILPVMDWVDPTGSGSPLHIRLAGYCGVLTKKEVNPDIPPLELVVEKLEMVGKQKANYLWTLRDKKAVGGNVLNRAKNRVSDLLGVCATPWNCDGPFRVDEDSPKLDRMRQLINAEPHEKWLLVSNRIELTDHIQKHLMETRRIRRIDSTKSNAALEAALFRSRAYDTMVMGAKCAVAHSFPECARMVVLGHEWSPFVLEQVIGRIYRVNSERPCKVWILVFKDTIEEIQLDAVLKKDRQIKALLGGSPIQVDSHDAIQILEMAQKQYKP